MRSLKWIVVGLLLGQASVVRGQVLEVVDSFPVHGSTLVSVDATVSFTFSEPVAFDPATYLVTWSGTFADRGHPFRRDPYLSDGGRTLNFPVVHRPNNDYVWYVYGVYSPDSSAGDSSALGVVPYVISYTTGADIGSAVVSGVVTDSDQSSNLALKTGGPTILGYQSELPPTRFEDLAGANQEEVVSRHGLDRLLGFSAMRSRLLGRIHDPSTGPGGRRRPFQSATDVSPMDTPDGSSRAVERRPTSILSTIAGTAYRSAGRDAGDHALVLLESANNGIAGGASVNLADGSYRIDYLREGDYLPIVTQVIPSPGGQISRIGFYDPDGDLRPDSLHVSGEVSEVDLALRDVSFYAVTARDAEGELRAHAAKRYPDTDLDLVSLETFTYRIDGRSVVWRAVYYSAMEGIQVIADWSVTSISSFAYNAPLPSSVRPIDDDYLNSDSAAGALFSDSRVEAFLEEHPEPSAGIFLTAGDYQFSAGADPPPDPERQVWRIKYDVDQTDARPSITGYLDLRTGEVFHIEAFVPLPPGTADTFATTALALASEKVADPSELELFHIASLADVEPSTGAASSWLFEYQTASTGVVFVELTPFGHTVDVDPWSELPDDAPRVPASYVDSDSAVALAEQSGGADFRGQFGGRISVEGGYVDPGVTGDSSHAGRAVWRIRYEGNDGGSMSFLADMETGELLATEIYEPLVPSTADAHEARAFELVSKRAQDPTALRLYQIRAVGGSDLDSLLFRGVSASWSYNYVSPDEGLFVIHLGAAGYTIQTDPEYVHPDSAPFVPEEHIDTDTALTAARQAGGAAFLDEFIEADVYVEGGYASSYQFEFPEYATRPVWMIRYSAFDGSALTIFLDMVTGELLDAVETRPRRAFTAVDAQPEALRLASELTPDSTRPKLFRIFASIDEPLDGTSTAWTFSYLHQKIGRIDVSLSETEDTTEVDSTYSHPAGAPLVPDTYIDSDEAVTIAEAMSTVRWFREEHGYDGLLLEGGYAEQLGYGEPLRGSRALWILQYLGDGGEPPPTLTIVLDMESGELVDSNISTSQGDVAVLPRKVDLYPNYPNPFNPSTSIQYDLPRAMNVKLTVFDALGREVIRLVDGHETAGRHTVVWEAGAVSSGLYFARLTADGATVVQPMLLQK